MISPNKLDGDFTPASAQVNRCDAKGNSLNNAAAINPAGNGVEYALPPCANSLDGWALRLVFQPKGSDLNKLILNTITLPHIDQPR